MRTTGHLRFVATASSAHFSWFAEFTGDQCDGLVARIDRVLLRAVTDIVPVASRFCEIGLGAPATVTGLDALPAGRFARAGQLG